MKPGATWPRQRVPREALRLQQNLEARVRAIAPPDTDIADLCRLADWLEQGATEAEALARLAAGYVERRHMTQQDAQAPDGNDERGPQRIDPRERPPGAYGDERVRLP